jgi:hypothetical protein
VRHSALSYIVLVSVVAATPAAHAQVANPFSRLETVTVTAAKLDLGDIIRSYVKGFAAPSPYLGKIARWKSGVCPKVMGLQPDAAALVADRITAVAKIVGAPVASEPCRTNVEIVVTPQPQALLDALREKRPDVFGYSSGPSQTASMAIMNRPIQAWYVTVTEDYAGVLHRDEMLDDCAMRTGRREDCSMLVSGFSRLDLITGPSLNRLNSGWTASVNTQHSPKLLPEPWRPRTRNLKRPSTSSRTPIPPTIFSAIVRRAKPRTVRSISA